MHHSGIIYTTNSGAGDDQVNALPMEEVRVKVQIVDVTARVTLIQRFFNASALTTGRAKYCFPVPASAVICAFQMTTSDGRTIKGECKEKGDAREQYELAMATGRTAGLLDYVTDDVFVISVGSFPPRTVVETRVVYVMTMITGDYTDQVQLILPKHVGQRYGTPPSILEGAYQPCEEARVSITVEIQMHGRIQEIVSPTHPGDISETKYSTHLGRPSKRRTTIRYRSPHYLEKDFQLKVIAEGLDKPRCFAEVLRDPDQGVPESLAFQLTMVPRHKLPPIPSQEYIFVVDRSGSMDGDRIRTATNVLSMLLRMIPSTRSTFNIFGFGNACEYWHPTSREYSQTSLEEAALYAKSLNADLGGTELQESLKVVFATCSKHVPVAVFLLTDGEVSDNGGCVEEVREFIASSNCRRRVFTLGIGHSVSTAMCEGIAKAGQGECLYALDPTSIVQQCSRLFTAGRTPFVRDVSIDWGVLDASASPTTPTTALPQPHSPRTTRLRPPSNLQQSPSLIHSIHSGTRMTIFALISQRNIHVPKAIILKGVLDDETRAPFSFRVDVHQTSLVDTSSLNIPMIHTMAAWKLVQEHEAGSSPLPQGIGSVATPEELRQSAITHLGLQYQIVTRSTSFVAVDGIRDMESGRKLKASFKNKHQEIQHWETELDDNPEDGGTSAGVDLPNAPPMIDRLLSAISSFGRFFGALLTPLPEPHPNTIVDAAASFEDAEMDVGDLRQPPGSWPDPGPNNGSAYDSDNGSPSFSGSDSDSSSARTFSTLSSFNRSVGSDRSSIYSSLESERDELVPPSPLLRPVDRALVGDQTDKPPTPPPHDLSPSVVKLVELQNADGSLSLDPMAQSILGAALAEEVQNLTRREQAAWATICYVAFLKRHLRDNPELLENLLAKAMDFLREQRGIDVDRLLGRAASLL